MEISEKQKLEMQIGLHQQNIIQKLEDLIEGRYYEKNKGNASVATIAKSIKESMIALGKLK